MAGTPRLRAGASHGSQARRHSARGARNHADGTLSTSISRSDSAACVVDTAVSLAKRIAEARKASGFINAVMRRATRETAPMPSRERDEKTFLAIALSHPRWMVDRFVDWFGVANAERLMTANNEAAPNVIRLNLARGSRAEIIEKLNADGFEIGTPGRAPETIVLAARRTSSRARIARACSMRNPRPRRWSRGCLRRRAGATVVDCAAAPGGKATHLAEIVGERGRVIARGPEFQWTQERARAGSPPAPSQCRIRLRRPDSPRAASRRRASTTSCSTRRAPDSAPCASIRRSSGASSRPIPRAWLRSNRGCSRTPRRWCVQEARWSIRSAVSRPKKATGVVDEFLARHDDFEIDRGIAGRDEFRDVIDARGFMKTRPDLGGLDGFFAARLIRR